MISLHQAIVPWAKLVRLGKVLEDVAVDLQRMFFAALPAFEFDLRMGEHS